MKYLLVIAVENYSDTRLTKVAYALDDANELTFAMEGLGYTKACQYVVLDELATKTTIDSTIRTLAARLTEDDELAIYYSGHGFYVNGENVLSARDTNRDDLPHTTVYLRTIFNILTKSACRKSIIFLDACHVGVTADESMRGIHANMSDVELRAFFDKAEYCVVFASCGAQQISYSLPSLKHGIWTYHLLQALRGLAPLALDGTRLTSMSLQNYLNKAVIQTLHDNAATMAGRSQTPCVFGNSTSEFLLADLAPLLETRKAVAAAGSLKIGSITLGGDRTLRARSLPALARKPELKACNSYNDGLVRSAGADLIPCTAPRIANAPQCFKN